MKYKVGDKVRVKKLDNYYCEDKKIFSNQIVTIVEVEVNEKYYKIKEDYGNWWWRDEEFKNMEEKMFSKKDLKFGDIVTLRNGIQGLITIEEVQYNDDTFNIINDFNDDLTHITNDKNLDIIKVQRYIHYSQYGDTIYTLTTLYERKEEILTEKEKEYLSGVIKPFRNDIDYISKVENGNGMFVYIRFNTDGDMNFPYLKSNTQYKGMKLRKDYTLEELGL